MQAKTRRAVALIGAAFALGGCGGSDDDNHFADRPSYLVGTPTATSYDGVSAGLHTGQATSLFGLLGYAAPAGADPTPAVLRTLQIQASYFGLLDLSAGGGFGTYFGTLDPRGNKGTEYVALTGDGSGKENIVVAVQVPSHFDPAHACIVAEASSGSRGVWGDVAITGEWTLSKGCVAVYTGKGTDAGAHDLDRDLSNALEGTLVPAGMRTDLAFNANLLGDNLAAFSAANPHRFALKHAHSKQNVEKDWGTAVLRAVQVAFYVLNQQFPTARLSPANTVVIAAGISNGGGAALRAAEQDTQGVIRGVVAAEPQVNMPDNAALMVSRGGATIASAGKPLYDYTTYANLLQPCAVQAPSLVAGEVFVSPAAGANRCAALAAAGVVTGATLTVQANDALAKLHAYGWEPESDILIDTHYGFEFTNLVAHTYANAYSRASVTESLCSYSVGGVGATVPGAPPDAALKVLWATGSGLASGPVTIVNDAALGGPAKDTVSISANSGVADYNAPGALCLRRLMTGAAVGTTTPSAAELAVAARVKTGMGEVRVNGNLHGKPTVIVQGRSDDLLPVNHASRPYAALNARADPAADLHYYELIDANHFDALVTFYPRVLIPVRLYSDRGLDLMWAKLTAGTALPPSQVVRSVARTSAAATLTDANVPAIAASPAAADRIAVAAGSTAVPD